MPNFSAIVIPMLNDNYAYYIHPSDNIQRGYFVDVSERMKVVKFRNDFGIFSPVSHIITTHKHHDHSGANLGL